MELSTADYSKVEVSKTNFSMLTELFNADYSNQNVRATQILFSINLQTDIYTENFFIFHNHSFQNRKQNHEAQQLHVISQNIN